MGTDVHAVFQKPADKGWERIESKWEQSRHYFLFSWLADVRNGYGFAGVPTYDPVKPIAEPRGLPADFSEEKDGVMWEGDEGGYLGDHSYSWLTLDEILAAEPPGAWCTGIVPRAFFDQWDGLTPPKEWSGGITGPDIRVAESPDEVKPDTTHVRIRFRRAASELDYFVDEIKRLKAEHGDGVRMVFGFDS